MVMFVHDVYTPFKFGHANDLKVLKTPELGNLGPNQSLNV